MYVMDGIAYAGDPSKKLTIVSVRPLDGYRLFLRFSTGESGVFDMGPMLDSPAFAPLRDKAEFDRVYIDFGALTWMDGEADLAPEYVYAHASFEEEQKRA